MLQTSTTLRHWFKSHWPQVYAFWKFSRPHTIIGTTLSVLALWLLAGTETSHWHLSLGDFHVMGVFESQDLWKLGIALLACLCGNVYIVGLNQLEDQAIDRINKPHLPLASGEFSVNQGRWIVAITGVAALLLALSQGHWLIATVGLSLLIGTAYSLPPIRLKRFPLWASLCILSVRGVIVNLGLFLHFSQVFGGQTSIPIQVWVLTAFILVFSIAIAICKDIPDAEGDRQYQISTLTLRLGASTVFNITRGLLSIAYLGLIVAAQFWLEFQNALIFQSIHLIILALFWIRSFRINRSDSNMSTQEQRQQITAFYQFIWKLFFLEYLLFPLFGSNLIL